MPKKYILSLAFFLLFILAIIYTFWCEIISWKWVADNEGLSAVIRNFALVIGGAIGLWLAIKRTIVANAQQRTVERGQITDRYSKAVEQLGNQENVSVRIGGLYALQRIAKDSDEDLPTVQNVIANFIRHPPYEAERKKMEEYYETDHNLERPDKYIDCPDIRVAFEIFQQFKKTVAPSLKRANLQYLNLQDIDFTELTLDKATFKKSDLTTSNFSKSKLWSVNLRHTNLCDTRFHSADINNCDFESSTLQGAKFNQSSIRHANFKSCSLSRTYFTETTIDNSNFNYIHVKSASFDNSILTFCQFENIKKLIGNFSKSEIQACSFSNSSIKSIQLAQTKIEYLNISNTYFDIEAQNALKHNISEHKFWCWNDKPPGVCDIESILNSLTIYPNERRFNYESYQKNGPPAIDFKPS